MISTVKIGYLYNAGIGNVNSENLETVETLICYQHEIESYFIQVMQCSELEIYSVQIYTCIISPQWC